MEVQRHSHASPVDPAIVPPVGSSPQPTPEPSDPSHTRSRALFSHAPPGEHSTCMPPLLAGASPDTMERSHMHNTCNKHLRTHPRDMSHEDLTGGLTRKCMLQFACASMWLVLASECRAPLLGGSLIMVVAQQRPRSACQDLYPTRRSTQTH